MPCLVQFLLQRRPHDQNKGGKESYRHHEGIEVREERSVLSGLYGQQVVFISRCGLILTRVVQNSLVEASQAKKLLRRVSTVVAVSKWTIANALLGYLLRVHLHKGTFELLKVTGDRLLHSPCFSVGGLLELLVE